MPSDPKDIPKDAILFLNYPDNQKVKAIRVQDESGDVCVKVGQVLYRVIDEWVMRPDGTPLCLYPSWEKK